MHARADVKSRADSSLLACCQGNAVIQHGGHDIHEWHATDGCREEVWSQVEDCSYKQPSCRAPLCIIQLLRRRQLGKQRTVAHSCQCCQSDAWLSACHTSLPMHAIACCLHAPCTWRIALNCIALLRSHLVRQR